MCKELDLCGIDINASIDSDKISKFDCGNDGLNQYLKEKAVSDSSFGVNKTTLFLNRDRELVGYYSLSSAYFQIKEAYDDKKFSNYYEKDYLKEEINLPSIQINNFAVDKKFQGQKFGTKMMFKLFCSIYIAATSSNLGITSITLNSLPEAEDFYKELGFEYLHKDFDDIVISNQYTQYSMMIRFASVFEYCINISQDLSTDFLGSYN